MILRSSSQANVEWSVDFFLDTKRNNPIYKYAQNTHKSKGNVLVLYPGLGFRQIFQYHEMVTFSLPPIRFVFIFVLCASFLYLTAQPVMADPTDSGSLTVAATVAPLATSVTTSITDSADSEVGQQQSVTYTIRFSSANVAAIPMQLQAQWAKGTIEGLDEATVNVAEYEVGSATPGPDGELPVIDTFNRTVTWNLTSVPGNSLEQVVRFKLKTTDSYTGSKTVRFPVRVSVISPVGTPDRTVMTEYLYQAPTTTTATAAPSSTPSPSPSAPSDSSLQSGLVQKVSVLGVGPTSASVGVQTSAVSQVVVRYGTLPTALTRTASVLTDTDSPTLAKAILTGLQPGSRYYFSVVATTQGVPDQVQSEIFAIETSAAAFDSLAQPTELTLSQNRVTLASRSITGDGSDLLDPVITARNTVLDVNLKLPTSEAIKSIAVALRVPGVLGATTDSLVPESTYTSNTTQLTRVGGETFAGKLRTPPQTGTYEVVSLLEDDLGNYQEYSIGAVRVISPFTVIDAFTKQPLSQARVELQAYNPSTQLYERLSSVSLVANPVFSDEAGLVALQLLAGKYQAEVQLPGYQATSLNFEISAKTDQLPVIELQRKTGLFQGRTEYYAALIGDLFYRVYQTIGQIGDSPWFISSVRLLTVVFVGILGGVWIILKRNPELDLEMVPHQMGNTPAHQITVWSLFFFLQAARLMGEVFVSLTTFVAVFYLSAFPLRIALQLLFLALIQLVVWITTFVYIKQRHARLLHRS